MMGTNHDGKREKTMSKAQDLINMFSELQRLKGNWAVFSIAVQVSLAEEHKVTTFTLDAMEDMNNAAVWLEKEIIELRGKVKE